MPPEEPGKVVALDLSLSKNVLVANGEMVMSSDTNLRISWYAQNVPENYIPICKGVAFAYKPSVRSVQPLSQMRPKVIRNRFSWREPVRQDGLMFILILPENKTIQKPFPIPIEAKLFEKRIALFWLVWPEDDLTAGNIEFQWELAEFQTDPDAEVESVNQFILDSKPRPESTEWDVALSFAGEDRMYVEEVAKMLQEMGVKVFYDKFETAKLWGKNLYDYLNEIYSKKSRYTVMFISKHYKAKAWTNYERETAQARAYADNREYILPVRFDETELPGMLSTTAYVSTKEYDPKELAELILAKVNS